MGRSSSTGTERSPYAFTGGVTIMADQTPETHQRRAEVIPLRPEAHAAEVVHDAEIVDEEPRQTYNTRRLPSVPDEVRQRFADVAGTTTHASVPVVRSGWRHARYLAGGGDREGGV